MHVCYTELYYGVNGVIKFEYVTYYCKHKNMYSVRHGLNALAYMADCSRKVLLGSCTVPAIISLLVCIHTLDCTTAYAAACDHLMQVCNHMIIQLRAMYEYTYAA